MTFLLLNVEAFEKFEHFVNQIILLFWCPFLWFR